MLGEPDKLAPIVVGEKWKFSAIDGDITLGDGVKCYATMHYPERLGDLGVREALDNTATRLRNYGANVIRKKIELVIYDSKQKESK
jgi:hypothetical protein